MSQDDRAFLPVEAPLALADLHSYLEGKQVSRLRLDMIEDGPPGSPTALFPHGGAGFGLELTTGERLLIFAVRTVVTRDHPYTAALTWRWLEPQIIQTPRMARYFGTGRDSGLDYAVTPHAKPDTPAPKADPVQARVEGAVIVGARAIEAPNVEGGQQGDIELVGGDVFHLEARPGGRPPFTADIVYELRTRPRASLFGPDGLTLH